MTLGEMLAGWVADYKVLSREEWSKMFGETRPGHFPIPRTSQEIEQGMTLGRAIGRLNGLGG